MHSRLIGCWMGVLPVLSQWQCGCGYVYFSITFLFLMALSCYEYIGSGFVYTENQLTLLTPTYIKLFRNGSYTGNVSTVRNFVITVIAIGNEDRYYS